MAQKERIDGPGIAAQILKKMPAADKKRLMQAIHESAPEVALQIEEKLYNFDDIKRLPKQSMQNLVRKIEHQDLVMSLKTASAGVKNALLSGMSQRKQELVQDDLKSLPPVRVVDIEEAQRRILEKAEELKLSDELRPGTKKDVWV